jgi:hypothetical protein
MEPSSEGGVVQSTVSLWPDLLNKAYGLRRGSQLTNLLERPRLFAQAEEAAPRKTLESSDTPVEQNDTRFATRVVLFKAGALLCGGYLLMDDHPTGAAVCLCGSIGIAGILVMGLARRRP